MSIRLCVFSAALFALCASGPLALAQDTAPDQPLLEDSAYLTHALDLLQNQHYRADTADWTALRAEAQAMLQPDGGREAAYAAIRHVIERLGERHTFLIPPQSAPSTTDRGAAPNAGSAPSAPRSESLPIWRSVDGNIGYAVLPGLNMIAGGQDLADAYSATLREGMEEMDGDASCGWIIDLRGNTGGNMWPMLAGLDPLLLDAPFGFFVTREYSVPWARTPVGIMGAREIDPAIAPAFTLANADRPVAVLLSGRTASSGEMVALALIGRNDVRTFGEPSAGFSTANTTFELDDGARLVITVSNAADRSGAVAQGALVPDEPASVEDAPFAARDWLTAHCAANGTGEPEG